MADGTQLEQATAPLGDIIATDDITDGGVANSQKAQRIKVGFGVDNAYVDVSFGVPLPVTIGVASPQVVDATSVTLAAGATVDLDSNQIGGGLTGKLAALSFGSTLAIRAELKTVLNAVETTIAVFFSLAGQSQWIEMPSKDYVTQAQNGGAGFDGFRLTITGLDPNGAGADVYATFIYDEE